MKTTVLILTLAFLLSGRSAAAYIPSGQSASDYVLPEDEMATVTRGTMTICNSSGYGRSKSLSFMQLRDAACPTETRKAVGWDRPQMEPISPGIPFQDQGIER